MTINTKGLSPFGLEAIERIRKGFGKDPGAFGTIADLKKSRAETNHITTGLAGLDRIIDGAGGIPRPGFIQINGDAGIGKTNLAMRIVKSAQDQGIRCAWIDFEHTVLHQIGFFEDSIGVDSSELWGVRPLVSEEGLEAIESFVSTRDWGLIVVDSLGAMYPSVLLEGEVNNPRPAARARFISDMLLRVNPFLDRNHISCILINHLTGDLATDFHGNQRLRAAGGKKLEYMTVLDIRLHRDGLPVNAAGKPAGKDEEAIGNWVTVKSERNKVGPRARKHSLFFRYGVGFDPFSDLISVGKEMGVIQVTGSWLSVGDQKWQGEAKLTSAMLDQPSVFQYLYKKVGEAIQAEIADRKAAARFRREQFMLGVKEGED